MEMNTNQFKELVVALDIGTSKVCALAGWLLPILKKQ